MDDIQKNRMATALRALQCSACAHVGLAPPDAAGNVRCPQCGARFPLRDGVLDLLGAEPSGLTFAQRTGQWDVTVFAYERIWRTKALGILAGEDFPPEREIAMLLEALRVPLEARPSGVFVDLACSTGYYGRPLARKLLEQGGSDACVVGVDLSMRMLQEARANARREGCADAMMWVRADAARLPFADESVAGIACGGTLNEYRDALAVLRASARALDPTCGRYFVMNQLDPPAPVRRVLSAFGGLTFFTRAELNALFFQANLHILRASDYGKIAITELSRPSAPAEDGSSGAARVRDSRSQDVGQDDAG
jgi:SAM-dependent methyltransferase